MTQSRVKLMQFKKELQTANKQKKKKGMKMTNYLLRIKYLVDSLGYAGHVLSVEDHTIHMLSGLIAEHNPVLMIINAKRESYTVAEVSSLLLQNEKMLEDLVNMIESFAANLTVSNSNNQKRGGYNSSNRGYYNNHGGQRGGYTSYNQGGQNSGGYVYNQGASGRGQSARGRGRNNLNRLQC